MTRLAIVPLSLYAGKNTLSPGFRVAGEVIEESEILSPDTCVGKGAPVRGLEAFGRASPPESGLYHAPRRLAEPRAQGRIRARAPERRGDRLGASLGHHEPRFLVFDDGADAAGRRGDHRRACGQRLENDVRQAVDVPAVVLDRRNDHDIGGRKVPAPTSS